ncbi:NAD(P)/FAD-dependent oxidoreductase [Leptospira ilyithenensis]|uniref:NAD(P)/FAD-dependent oxidoreductase n=1 Tax=Leptospira ilyithenensis TaxID=2484901 RepID=A0A4R9LM24_9LEPT|nr:NAD(P)/FAD-dependent oxidoreductase [Leptospira ilyithenensis]TGN07038.1 NAD(P)/FAD-dependent oxidoreductase [Leptospira ilyithenensis]
MIRLAVLGGGAAGCFAAIQSKELGKENIQITIYEKSKEPLSKVRISGGGRCNVTHHLFEPETLSKRYPRGEKELRWAFESFGPEDTIDWFRKRGVDLKTEADGRMFPVTDDSEAIIDCFLEEIGKKNIHLNLELGVSSVFLEPDPKKGRFRLLLDNEQEVYYDSILIATGSNRKVWGWMEALGHRLIAPVPSLFTLALENTNIMELTGLSVTEANIRILPKGKPQSGPLLITHWGLSGPAALRLSAWEARTFAETDYKANLEVNWIGSITFMELEELFLDYKSVHKAVKMINKRLDSIPGRLWEWFLLQAKISTDKRWSDISKQEIRSLADIITRSKFQMKAKGVFKEEFVTAGGISRKDIDFSTMQSKVIPGLYFAGEVIDVDGITGGFNFQNAWTTATIAARSISVS